MAQGRDDGEIAPRRSLGGRILPPPAADSEQEARDAEQERARLEQADRDRADQERAAQERAAQKRADRERAQSEKASKRASRKAPKPAQVAAVEAPSATRVSAEGTPVSAPAKAAPRRSRRAQLRLVQIDAWSVMKTSFLLSIAFGIVLVVAVSIIWAVLGAAGVWDSINSIVQQAVGGSGAPFDITEYLGTSRVLGFTMVVAVVDVVLITAIATLGAFLYNLAAALLGGIEVTLAEDN